MQQPRRAPMVIAAFASLLVLTSPGLAFADHTSQDGQGANQNTQHGDQHGDSGDDAHHDVSPPLRALASAPHVTRGEHPDQPLSGGPVLGL